MRQFMCIDVGGTAIKYGVLNEKAQVMERMSTPTESWKGGPYIVEKVLDIISRYQKRVEGVCLSSAGMVDVEKGEIFFSGPTIPQYAGTKYKAIVEDTFHIPCELENDVNCAGLAEAVSGAGKGCESVLCLTVGTGIGGCFVRKGSVYHGWSGSGCEVGYMRMEDSDFQTLGSARAVSGRVALAKGDDPREWSGIRVFSGIRDGDRDCIESVDRMIQVLGLGIANICCVLNPQMVVLGGGIMQQEDYLYPRLRASLDEHLIASIAEKTSLAMASYRNAAGMIGAFYHFCQRHPETGLVFGPQEA